jgi:hypothetical protein
MIGNLHNYFHISKSRDRLVVRTLRCGRSNPGSNPGHGSVNSLLRRRFFFLMGGLVCKADFMVLPGIFDCKKKTC